MAGVQCSFVANVPTHATGGLHVLHGVQSGVPREERWTAASLTISASTGVCRWQAAHGERSRPVAIQSGQSFA